MGNKRSKASANRYGHSEGIDYSFNQEAGALKTLSGIMGYLTPLGDIAAAEPVGAGQLIAIWNHDPIPSYVMTGSAGMAAPTSAANGIAIPPHSYIIIATGPNTHIRGSSANVFAYSIADDLLYNPKSGIV